MQQQQQVNSICEYSVSIWEVILIIIGAIALIGTGFAWIGMRMLNNTFNPTRAEQVARSLIDYQIPSGSTGVMGLNIGAETFAIVKSNTEPPDIFLYASKAPSDRISEETPVNLGDAIALENSVNGQFVFSNIDRTQKTLCDQKTSITVQTGQQIDATTNTTKPAIQYSARLTDGKIERIISIIAIGNNMETKAEQVLNSIQCK